MKKVVISIGLFFACACASAQNPTKEFEIESILVDACNFTSVEPNNEMLVFKVGPNPINISNLTVAGQLGAQTYTVNNWPTLNSSWNGLIQNAATASVTAALQSTITNGCGQLVEPPGGIIPPFASVLMVTSTTPSTTDNSFAALTDSLYIIYHNATYTVTTGHFKNSPCVGSALSATPCTYTAPANRGFILMDNSTGASDTVTYDITLLTNTLTATPYGGSTAQNDGATVRYAWPGFPTSTYENQGCKAPFIPLSASASPTNTTICNNGSASLSGTAAGTYTSVAWSGGSGTFGSPNSLNTTYTPGASDNGVVILTLTVNGKCMGAVATATVAVTVNNPPIPSITSSGGTTFCSGTSTTLSVTSTGTLSTTYTWSPGSSSATSITVTPAAGTQIYTVDASNACGTLSTTFTLNVNALPVLSVVNDTACAGASATLSVSGASTYTWNTGAQGSSLSASPATTTPYTVTGTDGNGCSASANGQIFIYQLPAVTVNSPSVCPGGTVTLNAAGANTFTWSNSQNGSSISVTPSSSGTISVTGTDTHSCSATATASITVFASPSVTVNNSTICPGNSAVLNASGASTYVWSNGSVTPSITVTPSGNTSYTVVGTSVNGCKDSSIATVSVVNSLTVTASPASSPICKGTSTTLNGNGANTYTWSPVSSLSSSNGTSVTASPTVTTTYTVVGSSGSCADTSTVTVTVNQLPNVTANSGTICLGQQTATLTAGGATSYTWSPSTGLSSSTGTSVNANPTATTTYVVTGTDNNGCTNTATLSVVVNQLPPVSVTPISVCPGVSGTLTASGASGYSWSSGQTGASIPVPGTAAQYTVTGTDANGCVNTATVSVSLLSAPTMPTVTGTSVICNGQAGNLSVTTAGTYSWTGPGGSLGSGSSVIVTQAGVYTVTSTNSCGSVNSTFTVNVSTPQAGFVPNPAGGTAPVSVTFSNSSTGTQLSNYWNFANGDTSHALNPTETYNAGGIYNVVLVVIDQYGCMDTAMHTIVVTDTILPTIIPNVFSPNGDAINDLFTVSVDAAGGFNCQIYDRWGLLLFEWTDMKGGWDGKNASNGSNASDGTYYYLVTYIDRSGNSVKKPGFLQLVR